MRRCPLDFRYRFGLLYGAIRSCRIRFLRKVLAWISATQGGCPGFFSAVIRKILIATIHLEEAMSKKEQLAPAYVRGLKDNFFFIEELQEKGRRRGRYLWP